MIAYNAEKQSWNTCWFLFGVQYVPLAFPKYVPTRTCQSTNRASTPWTSSAGDSTVHFIHEIAEILSFLVSDGSGQCEYGPTTRGEAISATRLVEFKLMLYTPLSVRGWGVN